MKAAMLPLALLAVALPAATAAPLDPATIAGQYIAHHPNGDISGASYFTDDVLEIVPTKPGAAYVRLQSYFYNGHQCSLSGIAHVEGPRLVYRPKVQPGCTFGIRRNGASIALEDGDGQCRAYYCGARGGLDDPTSFAAKTRKPIRYMARLKASSEYRDALKEDAAK
jgi:hypothetical protein